MLWGCPHHRQSVWLCVTCGDPQVRPARQWEEGVGPLPSPKEAEALHSEHRGADSHPVAGRGTSRGEPEAWLLWLGFHSGGGVTGGHQADAPAREPSPDMMVEANFRRPTIGPQCPWEPVPTPGLTLVSLLLGLIPGGRRLWTRPGRWGEACWGISTSRSRGYGLSVCLQGHLGVTPR